MSLGLRKTLGMVLPIPALRNPPPVVSLVRLNGVIGHVGPLRNGLTLESLREPLDRAFAPKRLDAVALAINSPGGSPVQSALIAERIRELADEKKVRVLAYIEDVGASGGYWLASAADEILVDSSSVVGSIGVVSAGFGFPALLERLGVERRVETAGERKAMLDPFQPRDQAEVERLRGLLTELHENFKEQVRHRRKGRLKASEEELFSGEFWTGRKAVELGLADGLAHLHSDLRQRFGKKLVLRRTQRPRRWFSWRTAATGMPNDWADALLSAAEERALWARYGL
ncbi:S49 family peptidase [Aquibaculum arenosum]|uniref:S49 family peptidase n=1 Tax=Aquibaculum arenosum TaxID=3032591 RepID=A0ABT5YJE1_9PROT|nr:S49 family peptidase [Fodinicurvata sp. CAU 1616]MDF2095018.1 S49 family peptidase [Fodinicurvata sp. CAU 1616]